MKKSIVFLCAICMSMLLAVSVKVQPSVKNEIKTEQHEALIVSAGASSFL